MSKLRVALIGICLVVCAGVLFLQYRGLEQLRAENVLLHAQCVAVGEESKRPAKSEELERLRRAPAEVIRLRSLVEKLRSESQIQEAGPAPQIPAGFIPREWFRPAGCADFLSAYESAVSHLIEGNIPAYLDSFTPEAGEVEKKKLDREIEATKKTEAEIGAAWSKELAGFSGVRVVSTNVVSSNVVVMQIEAYSFNGIIARPYPVKVAQIGEEWKLITPPFNFQ